MRILYVEDDDQSAHLLARLLRQGGHRVTTARTITGARVLAEAAVFDLLIVDIHLPDGDGRAFVERWSGGAARGPSSSAVTRRPSGSSATDPSS